MIMKIVAILTVLLAIFIGCGGGGSSNDTESITVQMKNKHGILIIRNYPTKVCTDPATITDLEADGEIKDTISSIESNDISCDFYGRKNDINENEFYKVCLEQDTVLNTGKSCVFGFNATAKSTAIDSDLIVAITPII
jgi:hypothetical protein